MILKKRQKQSEANGTDAVSERKIAMRVSGVSVAVNLLLALFKLIAGLLAHSGAMVSDAVHSASDVFSTFIVMWGVKISGKQSDDEHPYGHERLECVASILLALLLGLTGVGIGTEGLRQIFGQQTGAVQMPGMLALFAAVISIFVKEWMYWYTRAAANRIHSGALLADAWHHRSDALSSIGALIGIGAARLGFYVAEPIASVLICLFIVKAAIDIFRDAIGKMVDRSLEEAEEKRMEQLICAQPGVLGVDSLKTRLFGSKVYVDLEIRVDGSLLLREAHRIAEAVHDAMEQQFPQVKHCMVHVNPSEEEEA